MILGDTLWTSFNSFEAVIRTNTSPKQGGSSQSRGKYSSCTASIPSSVDTVSESYTRSKLKKKKLEPLDRERFPRQNYRQGKAERAGKLILTNRSRSSRSPNPVGPPSLETRASFVAPKLQKGNTKNKVRKRSEIPHEAVARPVLRQVPPAVGSADSDPDPAGYRGLYLVNASFSGSRSQCRCLPPMPRPGLGLL